MLKIKETIRLKWELELDARQMAHSLSIVNSTVLDELRRAEQAGHPFLTSARHAGGAVVPR